MMIMLAYTLHLTISFVVCCLVNSTRSVDPDPTGCPSCYPTLSPTELPSMAPTMLPSSRPTSKPIVHPSLQPYLNPSTTPSKFPTLRPTFHPTLRPTLFPTLFPTKNPIGRPTSQPSTQPTTIPFMKPSCQPRSQPTRHPTLQPYNHPSDKPSPQPFLHPSVQPASHPSGQPSLQPASQPSMQPFSRPTFHPSIQPSSQPSGRPIVQPSSQPSSQPFFHPTTNPSKQPSKRPTVKPSSQPSMQPSWKPSLQPFCRPTSQPSFQPTEQPTSQPTVSPSSQPSRHPTSQPSQQPSEQPSVRPTSQPTMRPSSQPSRRPTTQPSGQPSQQPSAQPSSQPSCQPTEQPTSTPTMQPSSQPSRRPTTQPSGKPSQQPSVQPSSQPSCQPTEQPTSQPTMRPSSQPSRRPSTQPSMQPSEQPSGQPSQQPSAQPSSQPSCQPTEQPTSTPTMQPSSQPSRRPTTQPSEQPSEQPSGKPSQQPSAQPSSQPSFQPTEQPTSQPTVRPSSQPSRRPTTQPSLQPSEQPSGQPSQQPSAQPSSQPSFQPTSQPTVRPSSQPSRRPSTQPSMQPSEQPSGQPSQQPSAQPSSQPSFQPTEKPTSTPTVQPSSQPSRRPTTQPSVQPSEQPSGQPSQQPSAQPSSQPSCHPTEQPTSQPTVRPSSQPSRRPTSQPSLQPSEEPSGQPSQQPSAQPSSQPSFQPTEQPTTQPSFQPSIQPSVQPSEQPSLQPSNNPTVQPSMQPTGQPSNQPSCQPSFQPSVIPTMQPSMKPSLQPSLQPSCQPSIHPTFQPTSQPTGQPSNQPSNQPTNQPSKHPSNKPTTQPNAQPTSQPSLQPSKQPIRQPTARPSEQPSYQPTIQPTLQPSMQPSLQPTSQPTEQPSTQPTVQPTCQPSGQPTMHPSMQPTFQPSIQPSNVPTMHPSIQPFSLPTKQPSSKPSKQPSFQPFGRPTTLPSLQPSRKPTHQPKSHPTRQPVFHPSKQPSLQPHQNPTVRPTIQPSTKPSVQPSKCPSSFPTSQPRGKPSCIPSSCPTFIPSVQPSQQPTHKPIMRPSSFPSQQPAMKPSRQPVRRPSRDPSRQPTSKPTTVITPRQFYCDNSLNCETNNFVNCTFFSPHIIFNCQSNMEPCSITAEDITIGPSTNLTVVGTCALYLHATKNFNININSSITAPSMNLTAKSSLVVGGTIIYQSNMYITAQNVTLLPKSTIVPSSSSQPFCVQNALIADFSFSCATPGTEYSSISNNTISITASKSMYINTAITGSFIVLCSSIINIGSQAAISANGLGCPSGNGMGAGQPASGSTGGGGGGNGGAGGSGIGSSTNGGASLSGSNYFYAGSGGGAYSMSSYSYSRSTFTSKYSIAAENGQNGTIYPTGGTGGGVIVLIGTKSVALNGNLQSNGGNGGSNCGGGAGGTIAVNTLVLSGVGTLEANGGSGGSNPYPGGGGGGGYITLYNSANVYVQQSSQTFTYTGTMEAMGGYALAGASSGASGYLALPNCPAGYGNSASSSGVCTDPCNMCEICPVGTYSTGGTDQPCSSCSNRPNTHAYYTTLGETSSNCPFNCYDGYSTLACSQFDYYLGIITVEGFTFALFGVFLLFFLPLLYYRLKYRYGWFESSDRNKKNDLLFDIFIKFTGGQDDGYANNSDSNDAKDIANRTLAAIEQSGEKYGGRSQLRARGNIPTGRVERRKACRMSDQDLQNHACRINLLGSNSPFWFMGGPWLLSPVRPAALIPMLLREEYRALAEKINKEVSWNFWSVDLFTFMFVSIIAPPFSASYMASLREKRGRKLINLVAEYNYECFRCPLQQSHRNSLRIGISPDATLAYIDFLFDEEEYSQPMKPLSPVGQAKLPAAFKLAGLGTYMSPFYVDTNDMIFQAVPQTDVASVFIDEEWISFVVELNTILRTVHHQELHYGVLRLIKFLQKTQKDARLGGLVVEFCTFSNTYIHTEKERAERKSTVEVVRDSVLRSDLNEMEATKTRSFGDGNISEDEDDEGEEGEEDSYNRDSFAGLSGAHKDSISSNSGVGIWFLKHIGLHTRASNPGGMPSNTTGQKDVADCLSDTNESSMVPNYFLLQFQTSLRRMYRRMRRLYRRYSLKFDPFSAIPFNTKRPKGVLPDGMSLSFSQMCFALKRGVLKMGIYVSHEKVAMNRYIIGDTDYCSDDDRDVFSKDSWRFSVTSEDERKENFGLYLSSAVSSDAVIDSTATLNLKKVYGHKADEMAKFQRILSNAEENINAANIAAKSSSKTATPPGNTTPTEGGRTKGNHVTGLAASGSSVPSTDERRLPQRRKSSVIVDSMRLNAARVKSANVLPSNLTSPSAVPASASASGLSPSPPQPVKSTRRSSIRRPTLDSNKEYFEFIPGRRASINDRNEINAVRESIFLEDDEFDVADVEEGRVSKMSISNRSSIVSTRRSVSKGRKSLVKNVIDSKKQDKASMDQLKEPVKSPEKKFSLAKIFASSNVENESTVDISIASKSLQRSNLGIKDSLSGMLSISDSRSKGGERRSSVTAEELTAAKKILRPPDLRSSILMRASIAPRMSIIPRPRRHSATLTLSKVRNALKDKNLAPSASQHRINAWRLNKDDFEPTSDGLTALHATASSIEEKSSGVDFLPEETQPATLRRDRQSLNSEVSDAGSLNTTAVNRKPGIFINNPAFSFANPSLGNTGIATATGIKGVAPTVNVSDRDSATAVNRAEKAASVRTREVLPTALPYTIHILLDFWVSLLNWLIFGSNIFPIGPHYSWKILATILIALCFGDIFTVGMSFIDLFCVSTSASGTTECNNHDQLAIIILVWPFAIILAPLSGIVAIMLGPSAYLARIYCMFSHLAGINNIILFVTLLQNFDYIDAEPFSVYPLFFLSCSRLFQCLFIDLYISHIERMRFTRGWDGLNTSLFKTTDYKQEIIVIRNIKKDVVKKDVDK